MQIELIETFLDLCETRSFNRTADRLGVTQSTVSGRVKALERALDRRLFLRGRAGTELTTEGLRFQPYARSLRQDWVEALRTTQDAGATLKTFHISLQRDLADDHVGEWVRALRDVFPDTALYVEADFSNQMCIDLVKGQLDLAVIYTPKPHPDLHFESLSEITYRMVSDRARVLADVDIESYILAKYSPAFEQTHAIKHPRLQQAAVSSGQSALVTGLLEQLGGTAYVHQRSASELVAGGKYHFVTGAAPISQPIYAAVHLRNRHRSAYRRLIALLRHHFARRAGRDGDRADPRLQTGGRRAKARRD